MHESQKYWDARFKNNISLNTTGYLGMGSAYNRWLYKAYSRGISKLLSNNKLLLSSSTRVTDAGAGSGFLENYCQKRGVQNLLGLDFTASSVEYLKETFPQYSFLQWNLTQPLHQQPSQSSFTFCISVLYHIVSEAGFETALQNLSNLTQSGGHLIIADNFMPSEPVYAPESHQRHWSKERYEKILKSLGFEIITYQPIFFLLNTPIRHQDTFWGKRYLEAWTHVQKHIAGSPTREKIFSPTAYYIDWILERFFSTGPSSHYLLAKKNP